MEHHTLLHHHLPPLGGGGGGGGAGGGFQVEQMEDQAVNNETVKTAKNALRDIIREGGLSPLQSLHLTYGWLALVDLEEQAGDDQKASASAAEPPALFPEKML